MRPSDAVPSLDAVPSIRGRHQAVPTTDVVPTIRGRHHTPMTRGNAPLPMSSQSSRGRHRGRHPNTTTDVVPAVPGVYEVDPGRDVIGRDGRDELNPTPLEEETSRATA